MARLSEAEKIEKKRIYEEKKAAKIQLRDKKKKQRRQLAQIRNAYIREKTDNFSKIEKRHFAGKNENGEYIPAVRVLTELNKWAPIVLFAITLILSLVFPVLSAPLIIPCIAFGVITGFQTVDKILAKNAETSEDSLARFFAIGEIAVANALVVPAKLVVKGFNKISDKAKELRERRVEKRKAKDEEEKNEKEQAQTTTVEQFTNEVLNEENVMKVSRLKKLKNAFRKKAKTKEEEQNNETKTQEPQSLIQDEQSTVL